MILGYNGILKEVGYYLRFNYTFEQVASNIFVALYNQADFESMREYVAATPCLNSIKKEDKDFISLPLTTFLKGREVMYTILLDKEGIEVVIDE